MLLELVLLFSLIFLGLFLVYEYIYLPKRNKSQGKLIRILLFEKVGSNKIFLGKYKAEEKEDEKLGIYININKIKTAISGVNNSDFFPDREFGKCLLVCKFANDDFRVISRMKNQGWYKKTDLQPEEYLETEEVNDENGEIVKQIKVDEQGNPLPLLDSENVPLQDYELLPYDEPLGVSQDSREAMRFNRSFVRRMQEKRKEAGGFWDKYGQMILLSGVVIFFFIATIYMNNKYVEAQDRMITSFGEQSEKLIQEIKKPTFAENMLKTIEKRTTEKNAPPS